MVVRLVRTTTGFRRLEVITGVGRRRRWSDEEKAWIVAESLDPATTVSAVARRYGLHASQLFVWRQRLAAPAAREAPAFVPVLVAEDVRPRPRRRAGWRSRSARLSSASGRMSTPRHCAGCSRWCGACRDRGPAGVRILLATRPVDFRKGMDGLAALVQQALRADPFAGDVFIFRPRRADRVKILVYDGTGLVLYSKRLEAGRFCWPSPADGVVRLSAAQLAP
jgi:transposase